MRILLVSDDEDKWLYSCSKEELPEVDLIISCGDLNASYLEYLVTLMNKPLIYVHGNHDDRFDKNPPEGCICIDDEIFTYNGVRFLGLGGSMRYSNKKCMFTEKEMEKRVKRLWWKLLKNRGFDVLVTHAPSFGNGDLSDTPHSGFQVFNRIIDRYKPEFHFHGHVHKDYSNTFTRESVHASGTKIINAWGKYIVEIF